ncbi:ubiquitin C-terminal hydrolase [Magnaporthiopsis poae ATCC 64411]|uniref:ubiquitinyl hydrolase 1 n=1 Tax=Magnaporthiopsis poae (strain ATCC 64411 / 73-15) TaxID=644358 RepID=A0A0C4DSL2_MAGP6|nr:ubiquitin C-terminal hydrolase [Magnaporthiopsis poae ATCC 64411]
MGYYSGYVYPHAAPIPPPYQNGAQYPAANMPAQAYMPYPHYHARSPPTMHQYAHMMGAGVMQPQPQSQPQAYARNQQQSPIVVSSPYQTPPPSTRAASHNHAPVVPPQPAPRAPHQTSAQSHAPQGLSQASSQPQPPPHPQVVPPLKPLVVGSATPVVETPNTPSSTESTQAQAPAPPTPPTPQTIEAPAERSPSPKPQPQVKLSLPKTPFRPPLPWFTHPYDPFPSRSTRTKRRRRAFAYEEQTLSLPSKDDTPLSDTPEESASETAEEPQTKVSPASTATQPPARSATPSTQDQPSTTSTSPTTPTSVKAAPSTASASTPTVTKSTKVPVRAAVPAIPIIPALPKASPKDIKQSVPKSQAEPKVAAPADSAAAKAEAAEEPKVESATASAPAPSAPLLWTGLFSKTASSATAAAGASASGQAGTNGIAGSESAAGARGGASGFAQANHSSLAEALRAYRVGNGEKVAFLEPRGLINTGNMCYMNSVLQVLIFCIPFYDFLEQAGKKVAHSFNSDTPLIDAMIEFLRDFKIIDSAVSVDQLRRRLKNEELEQYGEPFIPEFVYEAIKKLPRFSSMRRGHQQDAEEFLGFLLESLHDECAHILRAVPPSSNVSTAPNSSLPTPTASVSSANLDSADASNVWLEVGPKQRSAITRSSGHSDTSSPITKIFGGQLRSELRVPGLKDSVTLEPYQPLQLDIGAPQVRNIVDALRHLTNPESLRGDFNSPRGKDVTATKQVFIESLPPVLILHLKRFQFDAEGNGTVKIWKKVGYPLDLEIPREVLSRAKRNSPSGMPKYRLIAAVYHHGKNASGGHYTVDVRRQDGSEWVRLDDTVIRRIRAEDVAEAGAEEEPSKSSESSGRKDGGSATATAANRFAGMGDEETADDDGWNQVSTPASGSKKWSSVVNGNSAPAATAKGRQAKDNVKDNKVAYLLFYQRV